MHLELISFNRCPFVQRSVITLLHKQSAYDITYIDLAAPPAWFLEISPFGRVPALRVDGETVLFESAIINEFIDDVTPGTLMPADPLLRAQNRGWIQFGEQCIGDQYQLGNAKDEKTWDDLLERTHRNLGKVEAILGAGPYFNGAAFSLVDAAYAPLFMRYALVREHLDVISTEDYPRLRAWSDALLALPEVRDSVVENFAELYRASIRDQGGYGASVLTPG
ncbi:glutathione S-transferase family protein [Acidihalobacter ferrooxydans]|uniref:Glutathione S-transferase n=1 Tax=Acidihalobacter ferrooxydans TaxID=1765967 RepID=A0A1P8UEF7_9GAMM|nr:glutathione S-transferase family protein [Acidihalobacter ferrooxydans]APZ42178.1 glutathione S-transferase [Acidihalobacter ferrooxydans]